jgi:hypothetical protein
VSPGCRVMAGRAIATQFPFVRFLFFVASYAVPLRFAIGGPGGMTARADAACVRPTQWEIRALVIELFPTQLDDVAGPAQMLRVTCTALRGPDARQVAVEAVFRADVGGDLLVAIEAEAGLMIPIAAIMAAGALLLVFFVSGAQFPGHEECLGVHGFTASRGYQTQEHSQH